MPPKPDLASHTLISFLDRFVYRSAKTAPSGPRGNSIMQPLAGSDARSVLLSNRTMSQEHEAVNSEAFWRKKVEDVAVDEVFFHKYFSQIGKVKQTLGREKKTGAEATEEASNEEEDGENEDEIWQALVESRPEVEGKSDDDSDLDMLDLENSEESSVGSAALIEDQEESELSDEDASHDWEAAETFFDEGDDVASDVDELFSKELQSTQADATSEEQSGRKNKKKKLKNLPTFASMEDYAEMIGEDEE